MASSTSTSSSGTVSLPAHLRESLETVLSIVPNSLATSLRPHIDSSSQIIPSSVLQQLAKWARSPEGLSALRTANLDPHDYSTIALFAGTRTTPNSSFSGSDLSAGTKSRKSGLRNDRKGVTALANAVFSVVGAGFAAYWAASNAGWGLHKVRGWCEVSAATLTGFQQSMFLGLFTAFVVGFSEAVLFTLWQRRVERRANAKKTFVKRVVRVEYPAEHPAADKEDSSAKPEDEDTSLRQRRIATGTGHDDVL